MVNFSYWNSKPQKSKKFLFHVNVTVVQWVKFHRDLRTIMLSRLETLRMCKESMIFASKHGTPYTVNNSARKPAALRNPRPFQRFAPAGKVVVVRRPLNQHDTLHCSRPIAPSDHFSREYYVLGPIAAVRTQTARSTWRMVPPLIPGQRSKPLNDAHSKNLRNNARADAAEKHVHSGFNGRAGIAPAATQTRPAFCYRERTALGIIGSRPPRYTSDIFVMYTVSCTTRRRKHFFVIEIFSPRTARTDRR